MAFSVAAAAPAAACTESPCTVTTESELRAAILFANANANTTINFQGDIALTTAGGGDLPALQGTGTVINGGGFKLSGTDPDTSDQYRGLFVYSGTVQIENLTIADTAAKGGSGGSGGLGGGGGAGLGGALFVNAGASVTVSNVSLTNNQAIGGSGGTGGTVGQGGGGGLGGDGGGSDGVSGLIGGGGGVGSGATGGSGTGPMPAPGSDGIVVGQPGGGGGALTGPGSVPGGLNGGGGGVDVFGGGGGVGGQKGGSFGGDGGFGGGGGAATLGRGGSGGFGGGGGITGEIVDGIGGDGGFGGGGGAGGGLGGAGGFGGGAGGNGFIGGGGGAGLGGAIFVVEGGTLNIAGDLTIDGGSVTPGSAGAGGTDGQAFGSGLFLQGDGTLTFAPGAGNTQTIEDDIADQTGSGGTGTDNFATGGPTCTVGVGCGTYSGAGSWALTKNNAGTTILSGTNTYTGGTNVNAGVLQFNQAASIGGTGANVNVAAGGTVAAGYAIDQDFLGRLDTDSAGVVALAVDSGNDLDFDAAGLDDVSLGAVGNATYSGTLTPAGVTYRLGGGGGNLTVTSNLTGGNALVVDTNGTPPGSVILTGTNTYLGGTTVGAGTLRAGSAGAFVANTAYAVNGGTLDLNDFDLTMSSLTGGGGTVNLGILDSTVLTVNQEGITAFLGEIEGTGSLLKQGGGTLILAGSSSYTGATTVDGGTLVVDGSIAASILTTVNNNGTLRGIGEVGALTVSSGGIIAPGNASTPIETLSAGPVTFNLGSFYDVQVDEAGQSDRIDVSGTATLGGGTVRVSVGGTMFSPVTTYTILTAGSVVGEFDDVNDNAAFLDPLLTYDAQHVFLTLVRNDIDLADVAETPNQRAVAGALDTLTMTDPLFLAVLGLNADNARAALDALSGEVHATVPGVLVHDSLLVRNAILDRLAQALHTGGGQGASQLAALAQGGPKVAALGQGGAAREGRMALGAHSTKDSVPSYGKGLAVWSQGYGAWGDFDGDGNAAAADRTLAGYISGVDADLGRGWRAGLASGYAQSDVSVPARRSSADIEGYHVAAYAGGPLGALTLRGGASWTWHDIETTRTVVFPHFFDRTEASYDGDTGQVFGEVALPLGTRHAALEPFAGLAWVRIDTDGFAESGGLAALASPGAEEETGYATLGLRTAGRLFADGLVLVPRLSVAWQHAFDDVTPVTALSFAAPGTGFAIAGVPIARDAALIEAGLDVALAPGASLGAFYSGQIAGDVEDHAVNGRLLWQF